MYDEHVRDRSEKQDGRKVLDRIERQFRIQERIDRVRERRLEQRIAVGRCFGDDLRGDVAARAGPDVHDHLLAPFLGELLRDGACGNVARAARRETDDEADGLARVLLRISTGCNSKYCNCLLYTSDAA